MKTWTQNCRDYVCQLINRCFKSILNNLLNFQISAVLHCVGVCGVQSLPIDFNLLTSLVPLIMTLLGLDSLPYFVNRYTSLLSISFEGVAVWDIIAELVQVCTTPCPPNPFAVDFDYFDALPLAQRALSSAAMVSFLQQVTGSGPHRYDRRGRRN